jgi:hypothetical protein
VSAKVLLFVRQDPTPELVMIDREMTELEKRDSEQRGIVKRDFVKSELGMISIEPTPLPPGVREGQLPDQE